MELSIIILRNIKTRSQQYGAWSDCMDVQAGLALYRWQRLITIGSSRIRVVTFFHSTSVLLLYISILQFGPVFYKLILIIFKHFIGILVLLIYYSSGMCFQMVMTLVHQTPTLVIYCPLCLAIFKSALYK